MKFLGQSFVVTTFAFAFGNALASNHDSRTLQSSGCGEGEDAVSITIVSDMWPEETSWTFRDTCTGVIMFAGDDIETGELISYDVADYYYDYDYDYTYEIVTGQYDFCVEADGSYTFEIFDSYGDGIIVGGGYTVSVGDETATGAAFGYGESKYFGPGCSLCGEDEDAVSITIVSDNYPEETSWTFRDTCTGVIMFAGDDIETGELISYDVADHYYDYDYDYYDYDYNYNSVTGQYDFCVEAGGSYTFEIFDSWGDGIYAPGGYTVSVGDETATGNAFGYGESKYFGPECSLGCEDSTNSFRGKDCNWVAQDPSERCGLCSGNDCVVAYCLVTCNNCP